MAYGVPLVAGVWGGAGLGYLLALIPLVGRLLLSETDMDGRTLCRAQAAFLDEQVFLSRDRRGILIFLAIYERRAIILADEGINRVVADGVWQTLVDDLVAGIHAGRPVDALCEAIDACVRVLEAHGISPLSDEQNELHNGLRLRGQ